MVSGSFVWLSQGTPSGFLFLMFVPSWTPVCFRTDKQSAVIIQVSTKRPYIEKTETGGLALVLPYSKVAEATVANSLYCHTVR